MAKLERCSKACTPLPRRPHWLCRLLRPRLRLVLLGTTAGPGQHIVGQWAVYDLRECRIVDEYSTGDVREARRWLRYHRRHRVRGCGCGKR